MTGARSTSTITLRLLTVAIVVLGFLVSVVATAPYAAPAHAAPPTGTGGQFVPVQTRLLDTRSSNPTTTTANTFQSVQVQGVGGIPNSGVTAVAISMTVLSPTTQGTATATADGDTTTAPTLLVYGAGSTGTVSASSIVPLFTDGKIQVRTQTAVQLIVDAEGYYLQGNGTTAAGGYVPLTPTRLADTRTTGTGLSQGRRATGSTYNVQVSGNAGIPAGASAVFALITPVSYSSSDAGYVTAWATSATRPGTSLNYLPGTSTVLGTSVPISSTGQLSIYVGGATTTVDLLVDVIGYYSANTGPGAFNPTSSRIYNSADSGANIAAGATATVQLTGLNEIPAAGQGVSAVAGSVQVLHNIAGSTSNSGTVYVYPSDQSVPVASTVNFPGGSSIRNNLALMQPGATGAVKIFNNSPDPINVVIDLEGWFTAASAAPQAAGPACDLSGTRGGGAVPVTRNLTDKTAMQFNATNGNLLLTGQLLHLRGVGQDVSIGWRYNAINDARPTLTAGATESALMPYASGAVEFVDPNGGCYLFTRKPGTAVTAADAFVSPPGVDATMSQPAGSPSQWNVQFHGTGITNVYSKIGQQLLLTRSTDTQTPANQIYYTYNSSNQLTTITDTQNRTVTLTYPNTTWSTQPTTITDNSLGRTITLTYGGPAGALSTVQDATGALTTLTYDTTGLIKIQDDDAHATTFAYDGLNRLGGFTFAAGTNAASAYGATYTGATTTNLVDPRGATTVYTFDANSHAITDTGDPNGNHKKTTWSPNLDPATRTSALSGITTYTNDTSNRLEKIQSPQMTGSSATQRESTAFYPTTSSGAPTGAGVPSDYQPEHTTDAQSNTTSYQYTDARQVRTATTSGTGGGTITYNHQGDNGTNCNAKSGEICTSVDANNNTTSYGYDTTGNLTSITPPVPLGVINYNVDPAGRVANQTDGRGVVTYTTYDNNDRITKVSSSATTCPAASCIRYTYNGEGWLTKRIDGTGTTTYTYDAQGRPKTKTVPVAGTATTTSATYDGNGNMLTYTDPAGTVTYRSDPGNRVIAMSNPGGSCPATVTFPNSTGCTTFGYDGNDQRNNVNYPNGQTITLSYDASQRQTSVRAATAQPANTTLVSRTYSYISGTKDTALRQTTTDQAGVTTTYSYDSVNRVTAATPSSGPSSTWTYDAAGNRLSQTINGTTTYYDYNGAEQLCWTGPSVGTSLTTPTPATCTQTPAGGTTYGFDGAGNLNATSGAPTGTAAFSYSTFGQMTASTIGTSSAAYTYADITSDERSSLTAGSTTTNFLNGIAGTTRTDANGGTEYVRDPAGTLIAKIDNTGTYYYTLDALGSVLLLTDGSVNVAASYTYDTWGNLAGSSGTQATANPYRYAGGYTDPTGLIKYGTRYYDPTLGRFTQRDPSQQGGNFYIYTGDNPVSRTDPSGRDWLDDALDIGSDVLGFAAAAADAVPGGQGLGLAFGALGVAADAGKAAYDCAGGGDDDCGSSIMDAAVGAVTFGVGKAAGYAGEEAYGTIFDGLGAASDAASTAGFYDQD